MHTSFQRMKITTKKCFDTKIKFLRGSIHTCLMLISLNKIKRLNGIDLGGKKIREVTEIGPDEPVGPVIKKFQHLQHTI